MLPHTQKHVVDRVNKLLRLCHQLSVSTAVEAILFFVVDDEVHCWSSPALEGLVTDHASRVVLKTLLLEPLSSKERQENIALYLTGKHQGEEPMGVTTEKDEGDEPDIPFIADVEVREKRFKEIVAHIYTEAEEICKLESPISEKTYNYLFLVALPTGRIMTFSTPGLKPLVATEHGKKLISTLLETNLKTMAEEADPVHRAREEAAIKRAKERMAKEQEEKK